MFQEKMITNEDDKLMVMAAVRYCLGRSRCMSRVGADWLKRNWHRIVPGEQNLLLGDIEDEIPRMQLETDIFVWKEFLKWAESQ